MIKTNMHIHSKYSWDCQMELPNIAKILVENNIRYAALTDHVEFDRENIWYIRRKLSMRDYEINRINEQYQGKLTLLKGIEISEPHLYPKQIETLTDAFHFDFLMGSIHSIPNLESENRQYVTFLYYKAILRMIESSSVDVIGHIDYINRYYKKDYSDENQIMEVLEAVKEKGKIIEINTSAKRRAGLNLFPSIDKLYKHKLMGDYVTIGTDAHREDELADNLEQAEITCEKIGLKPVIYQKRKRIVL